MKPFLKIGKYYHSMSATSFADFPIRLSRTRDGRYYRSLARLGEHRWWVVTVCPAGGEPDAAEIASHALRFVRLTSDSRCKK
jgi:hypothetical protein